MSRMKVKARGPVKLGPRGVFQVGDWVVFEDARADYPELNAEEDWSRLNGSLCIVREILPHDRSVWCDLVVGHWPNGDTRTRVDMRHFRRIVKAADIEK